MEQVETGILRTLVCGMYDLQKLRIQTGNRIVANFRAKLGIRPSEKEDTADAEEKALLERLRESYKRITDAIAEHPKGRVFPGDELISTKTEYVLVDNYIKMLMNETSHEREIKSMLDKFPIWNEFLLEVKGCGPLMAEVILVYLDPHKAKYPSSFWRYCGLDVGPDGKGRNRTQAHLVEREYKDKDGETKTKNGITFNPFLKTKLIGVLGSSFLRAGKNQYEQIYRDYKHRLESDPALSELSKAHRHNRAIRYMVKMFLLDLHVKWRELEGLEVSQSYHEAKLNHVHKAA